MNSKKRVLIAPLDWGLGHATRCVPIIRELIKQNAEVIIAADNRPLELLKKEFPNLEFIKFPGVSFEYKKNINLGLIVIVNLRRILYGMYREHKVLAKIISTNNIDAVISDHRYGAFSNSVPSIFIIHQIRILLPSAIRWSQEFVSWVSKLFMKKYWECWIPDFEGDQNLSSMLSHKTALPKNTFYIGPLSRLNKNPNSIKDIDVTVILSGPEPQRTVLEEILSKQLKNSKLTAVVIRGKTEENETIIENNLTFISALSSEALSKIIAQSKILISRPGYSTIMDFASVGAKAIFIPTPTQTEQEYLAAELHKKNICYFESQKKFLLTRSLERSKKFKGFESMNYDTSILKERISHLLKRATK